MSLRFRSHGRFQQAVLALSALGGTAGLILWALQVEVPLTVMAVVLGLVAGWLAHAAPPEGRRRAAVWRQLLATAAVVPACLTTTALFGDTSASPFAATLGGWSCGLVAGLGQLAVQLELVPADAVASSAAVEGRALGGQELALATRATAAWRRIRDGVAGAESHEARRLKRLAERLTIEVLALAARSHALTAELCSEDGSAVRERAAALSRAAARAADPAAREDLLRAVRETSALEERLALSCAARERALARLELQTTLLESTAVALAARRASVVADDAGALAPLCTGLGEAAGELQVEATALGELAGPV